MAKTAHFSERSTQKSGRPELIRSNGKPRDARKLSLDLREFTLEHYQLPKDGRKWKAAGRERMALAEWLATHGNGDGSRIYPGVNAMSEHFGWSRRKTFYLLADLESLELLEPDFEHTDAGGKTRKWERFARSGARSDHGTRIRKMNVGNCRRRATVQDSQPTVHSNVAHNRIHTDAADADRGFWVVGRNVESGGGTKSSSALPAKPKSDDDSVLPPDWSSIESKIENRLQKAKSVLLVKGFPPHFVDAALHYIEERSDHSGTVPCSAAYFLAAFNALLIDPRDRAKMIKRAQLRERTMPTESELLAAANDITREASRRPIKEVLEARASAKTGRG